MEGFVILHRSLMGWKWYSDTNCWRVYSHLLMNVNWQSKQWMGMEVQPGSIITSYASLADAVRLTVKQVRLAIDRCEESGMIVKNRAGQGLMISLVHWASQSEAANFMADLGQTSGRPRADKRQSEGSKRATTKQGNKGTKKQGNNNSSNEELADGHLPLDPIEAIPIKEPKPEKEDRRDPRINSVIDYLTDQLKKKDLAPSLDGTVKDNRFMANNLLNKLAKDYPTFDPVKSAHHLIDLALSIPFHAKNCTHVGYLFRNVGKIAAEKKTAANQPQKLSDEDYRQSVIDEAKRRYGSVV